MTTPTRQSRLTDVSPSRKEIALEMLRVSELPADGGPGRRFKLERRI